jgi:hypothetical protein
MFTYVVSAYDPDPNNRRVPVLSATNIQNGATFVDNGDGTGTFTWMPSTYQAGQIYVFPITAYYTDYPGAGTTADLTVKVRANTPSGFHFNAASTTRNQVNLSWNPDQGQNTGFILQRYLCGGGELQKTYYLPSGDTDYEDTLEITPGRRYYYCIIATGPDGNDLGLETNSDPADFIIQTLPNEPPAFNPPLTDKTAYAGKCLNFSATATDMDGDILTYSAVDLPTGAVLNNGTGAFSWTPTADQAGQAYTVNFCVSDGCDTISAPVAIKVRVNTPSNFAATAVRNQVSLSWKLTGQSTGFILERFDGPNAVFFKRNVFNLPANARTYTDTGLIPGKTYFYRLTATGPSGNSGTASLTVKTSPNKAPVFSPPLTAKTAYAGTRLSFTVSALDPDGDEIKLSAAGLPAGASFDPALGTFGWTPAAGQAGQKYAVSFSALDGYTTVTAPVTITVRPNTPSNLIATTAQSRVTLNWSLAGQSNGFILERFDGPNVLFKRSVFNLPAGARTYTDTGLIPGKTYFYRLTATGPSGNSGTAFVTVKVS